MTHICVKYTKSPLIQIVACRLFVAKPFPEPLQAHNQLDSREEISIKIIIKIWRFSFKKIWKKKPCKMAAILSRPQCVTMYTSIIMRGVLFTPPCLALNTLRPTRNRRHFEDDIFKCTFLNENIFILIKISLNGPINKISALVQIMAWHRPGDKPLSEPMMIILLAHYASLDLNELT